MKWIEKRYRKDMRWKKRHQWHPWFAWRPVIIPPMKFDSLEMPRMKVWLEWVERCFLDHRHQDSANIYVSPNDRGWFFDKRAYRLPRR